MAKPWRDVLANPAYQALPDEEKEAARTQYFDEVVAPQLSDPAQVQEARKQFDVQYGPFSSVKSGYSSTENAIRTSANDSDFARLITGKKRESQVASADEHPIGNFLGKIGGRQTLQGTIGTIGALGGDALNQTVLAPIDRAIGWGNVLGVGDKTYREAASEFADSIGMERPETSRDRILSDVAEGLSGTAMTLGAGAALNTGRNVVGAAGPSIAQRVGDFLTANPVLQALSTTTGTAASSGVREAGGNTLLQLGAGVAGGMLPGGANMLVPRTANEGIIPAAIAGTTRYAMRGSDPKRLEQLQRAVSDANETGISQSVGQATGNRFAQSLETFLGNVPGGAGVIAKNAKQKTDELDRYLNQLAADVSPQGARTAAQAGRVIERGVEGEGGFNELTKQKQGELYDALDRFIPSDSRVTIENTLSTIPRINGSIPGAPSTARMFQNEKISGIERALIDDTQGASATLTRPDVRAGADRLREDLSNQALIRRDELAELTGSERQQLIKTSQDDRERLLADAATKRQQLEGEADALRTRLTNEAARIEAENQRRAQLGMSNFERVPTRAEIEAQIPTREQIEAQIPTTADIDRQVMSMSEIDRRLTPDSAISDRNFGQDYIEKQVQEFLQSQVDGRLPYEALKKLRTLVGQEMDDATFGSPVSRSKWSPLYAALSKDLEKAAIQSGNQSAIRAWKRANNYTAALASRRKTIESVLDRNGGPEAVFNAAFSNTREGGTTLKAVMQSLPKESQGVLTASFLRRMARATPGQQNASGEALSMERFLTNWGSLSKEAKSALFDRYSPNFAKNIDTVARIADRVREGSRAFYNSSGSARQGALIGQIATTAAASGTSLATGNVATALFTLGGSLASSGVSNGLARLMVWPKAASWLAESTKVPASEIAAQLNVLQGVAQRSGDPEFVQAADDFRESVIEQELQPAQ